jgi:hypothetical protein
LPVNEYAREALKRGMALEAKFGTNPYKFGLIGATDSHTSLATAQEDNFFGKHSGAEPGPERMTHPFMSNENGTIMGWQQVSSGLAGVWARENTREAIFDAMERRETYATTGSRMRVRMFGGWNFTLADLNNRQPAFAGYNKGVPMGSDLPERGSGKSTPSFMIYAWRDPIGANLDRIQVVKGWYDGKKLHEKVYGQYGQRRERQLEQLHRLIRVGHRVDRPGFQAQTKSFLLCQGAGDTHTPLEHPRRLPFRDRYPRGSPGLHPGAGLYLTDLVHALDIMARLPFGRAIMSSR